MEEQLQTTAELDSTNTEVIEQFENVESVVDDQPGTESETDAENKQLNNETEESQTEQPSLTDDLEIDLGEGRNPVKFSELKNGYLRQSDYTKKTQALSEERKQFEQQIQEYEPVKQWVDYIQSNPYLFKQIDQAINEWNNTGYLPLSEVLEESPQAAQYINELMRQVNDLEKQLNDVNGQYQETKFGTEMNSVLSELKNEFKELVTPEYEQSLMKQAKENGFTAEVVKRIAKGDLADMKLKQLSQNTQKQKAQIEAETIKKLQKNATSSTGSLAQEGADHKVGYSSLSAAQKKALRERVLRGEAVQL